MRSRLQSNPHIVSKCKLAFGCISSNNSTLELAIVWGFSDSGCSVILLVYEAARICQNKRITFHRTRVGNFYLFKLYYAVTVYYRNQDDRRMHTSSAEGLS